MVIVFVLTILALLTFLGSIAHKGSGRGLLEAQVRQGRQHLKLGSAQFDTVLAHVEQVKEEGEEEVIAASRLHADIARSIVKHLDSRKIDADVSLAELNAMLHAIEQGTAELTTARQLLRALETRSPKEMH